MSVLDKIVFLLSKDERFNINKSEIHEKKIKWLTCLLSQQQTVYTGYNVFGVHQNMMLSQIT